MNSRVAPPATGPHAGSDQAHHGGNPTTIRATLLAPMSMRRSVDTGVALSTVARDRLGARRRALASIASVTGGLLVPHQLGQSRVPGKVREHERLWTSAIAVPRTRRRCRAAWAGAGRNSLSWWA